METGIGKLYSLGEKEFLQELKSQIIKSGNIADVFPNMVAYNVPLFALKHLWPEGLDHWKQDPRFPALAVAETDWKGKIYNLNSKIAEVKNRFILNYSKSYVMQSELVYLVVKYGDDFAIVRIDTLNDEPGQIWTSRDEADLLLKQSNGNVVDHFYLEGEASLVENFFKQVSSKEYARVALSIPRREASSLAVLSLGLLEHLQVNIPQSIIEIENKIFAARSSGELGKGLLEDSRSILEFFYDQVKSHDISPFWNRLKKLFYK